jgi:DNA-binding MarR family transcriptional regulator
VGDERADGVRLVVSLYREFEQVARRGDLSMTQYRTLLYLMSGARRSGELAAANAVSRPTVSAMISGLREEGWVEEHVDTRAANRDS